MIHYKILQSRLSQWIFQNLSFLVKQITRSIENLLFFDYDAQILVQETMDAYPNYDEVSLDLDTLTA